MKTAITRLLESMKFWTTLIAIIVTMFGAWLAKHGFDLSDEHTKNVAEGLTLFFSLLLGGQALTDAGKEKAKVEQSNVQIDPPNQAGFARLETFLIVVLLGVGIALIATACGTFKSEAKSAGRSAVDCMAPKLVESSGELASVLERSVPSVLSDTGKVDRAGFRALTAGLKSDAAGCAIATVIDRLSAPRGTDTKASPLAVDAKDLHDAWFEVESQQFAGRTFMTSGGS